MIITQGKKYCPNYLRLIPRIGFHSLDLPLSRTKIKNTDDIAAVAKASGMSKKDIETIKKHAFLTHMNFMTAKGHLHQAMTWRLRGNDLQMVFLKKEIYCFVA